MKVNITIPVYNEEQTLFLCISKLVTFLENNTRYNYEVIIADNASTDKTSEIARSLCRKHHRVKYVRLKEKGRGRALKKAWRLSKADILCYMDADLATDLSALPQLISAIKAGYDIAVGSRLIKGSKVKRSVLREILSRSYNFILRTFLGVKFKDAQCGFKAINRKVLQQIVPKIQDNNWFFDTELLFIAERMGFKIKEIPVLWVEEGTLLRNIDANNKKQLRKSKVQLIKTIFNYLNSIRRLRKKLYVIYNDE
ncbi:MAG: glycosyltransferase family 2 protein [Candidatus Woesearchaeota archaeon]